MNTKTLIVALIALLSVTGCVDRMSNTAIQARKDLRISLFEKCMKLLPAGPSETKYNDWDEVVSECGTQSYYMSR
jgi:hypothetical protein